MSIATSHGTAPNLVQNGYTEIWESIYAPVNAAAQMDITLIRSKEVNFTPASLMYAWALENGGGFRHVPLGGSRLIYKGKEWKYDHWAISPRADGMQMITLTLCEA